VSGCAGEGVCLDICEKCINYLFFRVHVTHHVLMPNRLRSYTGKTIIIF
jgi:hypothetical protein